MRKRIFSFGPGRYFIGLAVILVAAGIIALCFKPDSPGNENKAQVISPVKRVLRDEDFSRAQALLGEEKPEEALEIFEKITAGSGNPETIVNSLMEMAEIYRAGGRLDDARGAYEKVIYQFSSSDRISEAQERLGNLNMEILFSPVVAEESVFYEVKPGDSLFSIAKKFGTTVELIQRTNGLKGDRIVPGDKLKIYTGKFSVVVSKTRNTLTLKRGEKVLKVYNVSTGKDDLTPEGVFRVENRIVDPPWYRPGEIIPAGNPRNILGTRWLGISKKGYGIHGTNDPETIGIACTEGCVRMKNEDVEEIFAVLPINSEVVIIN